MESKSLFTTEIECKKTLRKSEFLAEMETVVPWAELCALIAPHYERKSRVGRRQFPLILMLKIHFLQQWFALSDPGVEEEIYDRQSFRSFLELDIVVDRIPDETTVLNFRRLLEKNQIGEQIFAKVAEILRNLPLRHFAVPVLLGKF